MKSSILKVCVLSAFLSPILLLASESNSHIAVGTRTHNETTIQKDEFTSRIDETCDSPKEESEDCCGFLFDKYPPVYYPSSVHWLVAVSALGDSVELEDGSVWKISLYDGYKALNWRSNDPLMITQNTRWFSKYDYRIVNQNTGTSLEASLFLGPIENGEYTRYVIGIDLNREELLLSDNTHWEISVLDDAVFHDWAIGDAVILGYNSGWNSSCESILINVNMNNFLRAKQF